MTKDGVATRFFDPQKIRDSYAGLVWPDEQVQLFSNIDRMFPTRVVRSGKRPYPLSYSENRLREFSFESAGTVVDLYDYVSRNRIAGILIIRDHEVLLERYELGINEHTRWLSMSMAKSISSTLVGAAIQDGYIDHLDDPLARYIPELEEGSYRDVSIRQLLRMTSGLRWDESHTDQDSERRQVLELQIGQEPGSILRFMSGLPRVAAAGRRWNYSTGETHLVGELLRAATGRWLADYLSEKIWSNLGMEADAAWWLESPGGLEVAGSGICSTLRDYGRFGLFMLNGGRIDGVPVLPDSWVEEASAPFMIDGAPVAYGYMWWPVPSPQGALDSDGFCARGIFGQRIYVRPERRLVVVVLSARSKPMEGQTIVDNDFFNALAELS